MQLKLPSTKFTLYSRVDSICTNRVLQTFQMNVIFFVSVDICEDRAVLGCTEIVQQKLRYRPVVAGCAGCAMAHPIFCRSVNPISIGQARLFPLPPITTVTPNFFQPSGITAYEAILGPTVSKYSQQVMPQVIVNTSITCFQAAHALSLQLHNPQFCCCRCCFHCLFLLFHRYTLVPRIPIIFSFFKLVICM